MNCRICGKAAYYVFSRGVYKIFECPCCFHRMTDVEEIDVWRVYSDDYFFGRGGEYSDYLAEKSRLIDRGVYYSSLISGLMKKGKMLDVGAAAGFMLKGFVESGWDGSGVEPNERMADYGRTRLRLKIHSGAIESFRGEETYDLVSLIQVIAHFPDPVKAVRSCAELLDVGGHILVETWDWKSLMARFFGKYWHEYSPPYVLQWFSWKSLNYLMSILGFEPVAKGFPQKKIAGQHAKFLIRANLADLRCARAVIGVANIIPGRVVIPYLGGDLFWALYRRKKPSVVNHK